MERALSKAARLRVIFLLEDTALYGGVKVVLHQANLLHRRGFRTTVVSKGGSPDWYPLEAPFLQVKSLSPEFFPPADVVIATFWTTIQAAAEVTGAAPLHYCQGFEGGLLHNQEDHPAIRAAYSLPVPAMTVSPSLAEFIEKEFHRPCRVVSPGVENFWKPMWRVSPHQEPRVLVMNPFEFYMKGVPVALEAIRLLRERGVRCRLFRLSQWPLSTAEREIVKPDEFHHNIPPHRGRPVAAPIGPAFGPVLGSGGIRPPGSRSHGLRRAGGRLGHTFIPLHHCWSGEARAL